MNFNPTTGAFSIPKPLIMFKDTFEEAIKKAKSEIGGKKTIVFLGIVTIFAGYLVYQKLKKLQIRKQISFEDL